VAISLANKNSGNLERAEVKMQSTTGNSMYALQDILRKEKGLVAIEKISKGTQILFEEPIITISRNKPVNKQLRTFICQQVDALSEYQRRAFLFMHNIHSYGNTAKQYFGIMRTNSLPTKIDGDKGAIFLEICRINHVCDNNAQKNWNENIKRHIVYALRDICKGEKITIYYLGVDKNRENRREAL
jgi:fructose-bisphosphate aldolase class 1